MTAVIDSLVRIDNQFAILKSFTGTPPIPSLIPTILKYTSYSIEQLDYLFKFLTPTEYKWWQSQYAKALNMQQSNFVLPNNQDTTSYASAPFSSYLSNPVIQRYPTTFIAFRTNAGVIQGTYPYHIGGLVEHTIAWYPKLHQSLMTIICTMDILPESKWEGPNWVTGPEPSGTELSSVGQQIELISSLKNESAIYTKKKIAIGSFNDSNTSYGLWMHKEALLIGLTTSLKI